MINQKKFISDATEADFPPEAGFMSADQIVESLQRELERAGKKATEMAGIVDDEKSQ